MIKRLGGRFARRTPLVICAALVVAFGYFACGSAAPQLRTDQTDNAATISKDQISNFTSGGNAYQVDQHLGYTDGKISGMTSTYPGQWGMPGCSFRETIGAANGVSGITFGAPGTSLPPMSFDIGATATNGLPSITLHNPGGPGLPVKWSNVDTPPAFTPPAGLSYSGFGTGLLISPTGTATSFTTLPITPGHCSMGFSGLFSKIADIKSPRPEDRIYINAQYFPLSGGSASFIPPPTMSNFLPFTLLRPDGTPDAYGLLPSIPSGWLTPTTFTIPQVPSSFWIPQCGQAGKPIIAFGPFSGDIGQTHVVFNGDPVDIQGETNSSIMFTLPSDIFGTTGLHIDDGPNHIVAKHTSIGLKLISDDHVLQPGEHDAFRVRVTGLDDLPKPVDVNIVDEDQDIVAMDEGQHVTFTITPGSGGTVSKDYGLTAIQKGAADIVAWVPQVWYDTSYTGDGQGTQTDTGGSSTGTVTTTDTTGTTTGQATGTSTDTTGTTETTGGSTGGASSGGTTGTTGTTGATGQTTGNSTGSTAGTTGTTTDSSQPGIAVEGWFEPVQGVWQDDEKFADKPTKQILQVNPTTWNAQLDMIVNRLTRLYGLKPDKHKYIEIKGETNRTVLTPVRFRFTLQQTGGPPTILYIEPEPHNSIYIDGPRGPIHKFDALLLAYDGIGKTDGDAFMIQNPGAYTIVADLIKPDGSPTGISVSAFGNAVRTVPVKVYFEPILLQKPRSGSVDVNIDLLHAHATQMSQAASSEIPLWFPITEDGFQTRCLATRDYRDEVRRSNAALIDVTEDLSKIRGDHFAALAARELSTQAYQEKANRIYVVMNDDDFELLGHSNAVAFTANQKVIFIREGEKADTVAHEYIHTTPFLWSSDQMEDLFGFNYHNIVTPRYADGALILPDREFRQPDKIAIMGSSSEVTDQWITQGTYWHLISEFLKPHDPPVVCVTAVIKNLGGQYGTEMAPLYQTMGEVDLQSGPGDWEIQLRDAAGKIQDRFGFTPEWQLPDTDRPSTYLGIAYRVPYMPSTAEIDIAGPGGNVLDSRKIGEHAPDVDITSPTDGGQAPVHDGKVTVTWTASDPNGGNLLYSVLYSPNNGDDWYTEAFEIPGTTFDVPLEHGTSQPRVKVIATDGSRSTETEAGFTAQ